MFYYLSQKVLSAAAGTEWANVLSFLRLFRYITFRTAGAAVTALVLCWWLGPKIIAWLKRLKFGQHYVDKAEEAGGLVARTSSTGSTRSSGAVASMRPGTRSVQSAGFSVGASRGSGLVSRRHPALISETRRSACVARTSSGNGC